jgi:hypothetical protein
MSRVRSGINRITERLSHRYGEAEVWFVDLAGDGDGLARLAGENDSPGLTPEEYDALPPNPNRTLVELVDAPEPEPEADP